MIPKKPEQLDVERFDMWLDEMGRQFMMRYAEWDQADQEQLATKLWAVHEAICDARDELEKLKNGQPSGEDGTRPSPEE